jgi:hypothetical protein
MTFSEIKKSTIEEFAEQLVAFDACPRSDGSEDICVVDSEGTPDCKTCWIMHLNGEDRENVIDDAKEYGRGYRV